MRPGVRTRDSHHVYRSFVLTVSFLRRPTSPAYSAALASGINQYPRADSLIVRFPRRSYESRVLVRRGVLTQSRASGPQSSASGRVANPSFSPQAYITGLLVRRGVVNQPRASDRVPDCSFSTQAYESRLQSIESRSAFPAPYTALRQLYRPFKVYPSYRHRTPPYLSTAHCFIPRSTRRRTTIGVLYIDPARSEAAAFA